MRSSLVSFIVLIWVPLAAGQGDFVNFEVPQVKPIDVIRDVGGSSWVLACNTPDNSLQIYEVGVGGAELTPRQRIPTGLGPVTVRYLPSQSSIYVANYIGDSITRIDFSVSGTTATARLMRTEYVGDSPTDFALDPANPAELQVVLSTRSELVTISALNLLPTGAPAIPILDTTTANAERMKEPRRIVYGSSDAFTDRPFVLNFRGDNGVNPLAAGANPNGYDLDLLIGDFSTPIPTTLPGVRGLGSTNASMAFDSGDNLYIVGSLARNDIVDKNNLRVLPTGFVESWIWRRDGAGAVTGRNLNVSATTGVPPITSWPLADPVSMPMDLVVRESGAASPTIFVASFQSDRIVVLDTSSGVPATWTRTFLTPSAPLPGYSQSGPRGLALKESVATIPGDPGARLYCLNRLDNSLSVFDPDNLAAGELVKTGLGFDPTPAVVRVGRRFLYDSVYTSGSGLVACGSCHLDGRTDGLAWKLDGPTDPNVPLPFYLADGVRDTSNATNPWTPAMYWWPGDRQLKVTQTLQGLLNHPVEPPAELLFSNAPYHWRGDKGSFLAFNEAFVNLQGMTSLPGQPAAGPMAAGLTSSTVTAGIPGEMDAFRDFVNTIVYPPNPAQDVSRILRQDSSIPVVPGTTAFSALPDGTNALRGLSIFHSRAINQMGTIGLVQAGGRSCVHCHALPEGSNNRITVRDNTAGVLLDRQPLETAALRGLAAREGAMATDNRVSMGPPMPPGPLFPNANAIAGPGRFQSAATAGLLQGGGNGLNVNSFMTAVFLPLEYQLTPGVPPGPAQGTVCPACPSVLDVGAIEDLVALVREFDWGIAPIVGVTRTYDVTTAASGPGELMLFGEMEASQANCDVVIFREVAGNLTGYYYDVGSTLYVDPAMPTAALTRTAVFQGLASGDRVIAMAVPVGSGRRIADLNPSVPLPAPAVVMPTATLEPMVVGEPWGTIPALTGNSSVFPWFPGVIPWMGTGVSPPSIFPGTISAQAALQLSVINNLPGAAPSLTAARHEPPRRFRVTGTDIQYGARLRIGIPLGNAAPPPVGSTMPAPASVFEIELPLFPNTNRTGTLGWETAAEVDPLMLYIFMNGGPFAPGVIPLLAGDIGPAAWYAAYTSLDPASWNRFWIQVVNPGPGPGNVSAGVWARVRLP